MSDSRRIPFIYLTITIALVVIAGIMYYIFASRYTQELYYKYLHEKAHFIGIEKFDKDELDSVKYQNIVNQRRNSIPTSEELFIRITDPNADNKLSEYLSADEIATLKEEKEVDFYKNRKVGSAIILDDNSGTYAVVVISNNPYVNEIAKTIGWSTFALAVFATIILYLISRLYAIRIVDRIKSDYMTEKLFMNNASHEINNPLTAIQGECEITLMKDRTVEEYKNSMQRIANETDRIIDIISQLLHFSNTLSEEYTPDSLDRVRMSTFMEQFKTPDTNIKIINDFYVYIREDLLLIAVRNIINNARKYSDGKAITVTINKGMLNIADQGIGIPTEEIQHIFKPFYRAENTSKYEGHGIGLPLSKAIFEKFGANIYVSSSPNKGANFTITFTKYD